MNTEIWIRSENKIALGEKLIIIKKKSADEKKKKLMSYILHNKSMEDAGI